MRKWFATVAILCFCSASLRADIRVTQSRTVSGPAAVMMPAEGLPKTTIRIKGMKARTDIDKYGETDTKLADVEAKHVLLLRARSTIAQVIASPSVPADGSWSDISLQPTGKSRMIGGVSCDEHTFTLSVAMASVPNPHIPPEAMKGVSMRMNGSVWIAKSAPGAAEWTTFIRAALNSRLLSAITGTGSDPWMDKLFEVAATAGIPYLIEMSRRYEGSGLMMPAMKDLGTMKMVQKVTVSTEPIAADLFNLPAGYTVEKR